MPNDYNYEQLAADVLGISVEENARRNAEALRNTAARRSMVQTATEQRRREREQGRALRARNEQRLTSVAPTSNSYITDFESSPVITHAVSVNQSRPIHADFDSSFAYSMFLNSKYKHHHKCTTCLSVFRCGQAKCDRTLCRICNLSNELSTATWPTDEVVSIGFNGGSGGSWHNNYMVHEASELAAQNQVTVDYEAVERRVLACTSFLQDLAPERSTEEES